MWSSCRSFRPFLPVWPRRSVPVFGVVLTFCYAGCVRGYNPSQPTESGPRELPGVDLSELTGRERRAWSTAVSELLAPCADQPVSLATCVREQRPCRACLPAASFIARELRLGKSPGQVEAAYQMRFDPEQVKAIELGNSPWKGAASAPVVIAKWADFECHYCQRTAVALDTMLQAFPRQLKVVFKHYPISSHPGARRAALASAAAQRQGKFWRLHDLMYLNPTQLDDVGIERLATQAGLDLERFRRDL
ncbi:DsbA family protein, partial [Myxococcota bacterium]